MFMNNMKEATTDAMKETTGKVVNEKEKATTENIETIKKTMENTDGIDPKLPRFLAIWSGFCIVLYALGYFGVSPKTQLQVYTLKYIIS